MKRRVSLLLILSMLLILVACGGEPEQTPTPTPTATEEPTPTVEPTQTPEPTETPMPYTNPLTGEGLEEDVSDIRPWAIMINNLKQALPQCGISQAELIYEIPAEGGVTRMMAIFLDISDDEVIGSMRSLRPYYADVALSYGAIVVHAGGSQASYTELSSFGMDHLDGVLGSYVEGAFYRDSARMQYGYEHSMFANGPKLIQAATDEGFALDRDGNTTGYGLSFSENAVNQCEGTADYVCVNFNSFKSTSFEYDADTGLYSAFEYGAEYIDGNSGDQMTFTNVIVLETSISVLDSVGRLAVELTGTGKGWFVTGGKSVEITWSRDEKTDRFSYYLDDGMELNLGIGNSYIGVIPDYGSSVVFEK